MNLNTIFNILILITVIIIAKEFAFFITKKTDIIEPVKINLVSEGDKIEYFSNLKLTNNDFYNKTPKNDDFAIVNKTPDVDNPIGNQDEIDQYIKDFFLQDQFLKKPNVKITSEWTKRYRDNYFTFKDNVFKESQQYSPADRALQMKVDETHFSGRKISDVYDELVDVHDLYDKQLLRMPKQDTSAIENVLYVKKGANGDYVADDLWIYDKDRVMNGGMFYNEVYPGDRINEQKYVGK